MLIPLKAFEEGSYLTVTICPAFGLRPQVEITANKLKKFNGIEGLKLEAEKQALERGYPLGIMDYNGNFVFKSSNWQISNLRKEREMFTLLVTTIAPTGIYHIETEPMSLDQVTILYNARQERLSSLGAVYNDANKEWELGAGYSYIVEVLPYVMADEN